MRSKNSLGPMQNFLSRSSRSFSASNRGFWDKTLVVETIQMAKSARVQKKAEDEQVHDAIVEDITTDDEDDD